MGATLLKAREAINAERVGRCGRTYKVMPRETSGRNAIIVVSSALAGEVVGDVPRPLLSTVPGRVAQQPISLVPVRHRRSAFGEAGRSDG